jgi:hypothetical protein
MEIVCDVRLLTVGVKITVFWGMTPCTLLKSCRRSEAPAAPCYHSASVKAHGAHHIDHENFQSANLFWNTDPNLPSSSLLPNSVETVGCLLFYVMGVKPGLSY